MRKYIFLYILLLFGCSTSVPVTSKFPDAVPNLMKKCEDLITIEGDNVPITELLKTVVNNYTLYYQCSSKVDGWQEWYEKQKKNYNSIKR